MSESDVSSSVGEVKHTVEIDKTVVEIDRTIETCEKLSTVLFMLCVVFGASLLGTIIVYFLVK